MKGATRSAAGRVERSPNAARPLTALEDHTLNNRIEEDRNPTPQRTPSQDSVDRLIEEERPLGEPTLQRPPRMDSETTSLEEEPRRGRPRQATSYDSDSSSDRSTTPHRTRRPSCSPRRPRPQQRQRSDSRASSTTTRRTGGHEDDTSAVRIMLRMMADQREEERRAIAAQREEDRRFQERLFEQLVSRPSPSRPKEYERPPRYPCDILKEEASGVLVDDWIFAVQSANDMRTSATHFQKILWATTHISKTLQTQWRNHSKMMEDPSWEDFTSFLRKQHVDPETREIELRDELMTLRQTAEQSPTDHFDAWRAIHNSLGTPNPEDDRILAHQYYFGLQPRIKKEIRKMKIGIWKARELAQEAERLWQHLPHFADHSRNESRKRSGTSSNQEGPRKSKSSDHRHNHSSRGRSHGRSSSHPRGGTHANRYEDRRKQDDHSANKFIKGITCHNCNKEGHLARNCRKPRNKPEFYAGNKKPYETAAIQSITTRTKEVDSSENE